MFGNLILGRTEPCVAPIGIVDGTLWVSASGLYTGATKFGTTPKP
jgi:hypothetical protein